MNTKETAKIKRKLLRKETLATLGLVILLALGVMGATGAFSNISAVPKMFSSLVETGLKEENSNLLAESLNPPQAAPQLSKKYIYAGSRMLAVEDYGVAPTPPPPTPTPTPGAGGGSTPTPTPTPPPTGTSATFLGTDTTTQGNWTTGYGSQGYSIIGDTANIPAWASLTTTGNSSVIWANPTADTRALIKASNTSSRIAACWYTTPSNTAGAQYAINLNLNDGQVHRVALYALNWDNLNRNEIFEVINTSTGAILDTRSLSSFYGGVYLNWNASGQISIRVKNTSSTNINAVISGVFIDSPAVVQPQRVNFALASNGGVATGSSQWSALFPASSAINGDRKGLGWAVNSNGGWSDGTSGVYPDWLQVDFNSTKSVDEIDVFTVQNNWQNPLEPTETTTFTTYGITAFDVQYWNGSSWVTVPNGSVTGNNKVWRKFTFSAVTTTKVRVVMNGAVDGVSRITELEAWGNQ